MKIQLPLLIPYIVSYAIVLLVGVFYAFFFEISTLVATFATLSAICVFTSANIAQWYAFHRHDNCKSSSRSVIYDAIYGIILKYMIMIFLLMFYFKKINIQDDLFIINFILLIIIKIIFNNLFYRLYK